MVESLIWFLVDLIDSAGRTFTFGMPMDKRIELLRALGLQALADRPDGLTAQFTTIITELKESNSARNTIIHGEWGLENFTLADLFKDPEEQTKSAVATKIRKNDQPLKFSINDVEAVAVRIAEAKKSLLNFFLEYLPEPGELGFRLIDSKT